MSRRDPSSLICVLLVATVCIGSSRAEEGEKGYVVFEHHPLERMASDHVPDPNRITNRLPCSLARGEYTARVIGKAP